jgi:hypothetical protein
VFQKKPTSRRVVELVVVGNEEVPEASNDVPQVKAIDVVPVIEMRNVSPSTGVPVRLDVNEVIAVDCDVM